MVDKRQIASILAKNKKQAQKAMPWAVIVVPEGGGSWAGFSHIEDYRSYKKGTMHSG